GTGGRKRTATESCGSPSVPPRRSSSSLCSVESQSAKRSATDGRPGIRWTPSSVTTTAVGPSVSAIVPTKKSGIRPYCIVVAHRQDHAPEQVAPTGPLVRRRHLGEREAVHDRRRREPA